MDYSATQPAPTSPTPVADLTHLRNDFDYDYDLGERHVWHTAKSTSKMPNKLPNKQLKMPPLTKIVVRKQLTRIQPKEPEDIKPILPILSPIIAVPPPTPKKKCIPRRNSVRGRLGTKNATIISPSKDVLDTLNEENIIYRENSDKPWVCKVCGRDYKWKNSLICHKKHECGISPKFFCVRKCGYKTHIHSNLKRHMNSKFCKPPDSSKSTKKEIIFP